MFKNCHWLSLSGHKMNWRGLTRQGEIDVRRERGEQGEIEVQQLRTGVFPGVFPIAHLTPIKDRKIEVYGTSITGEAIGRTAGMIWI